MSNRALIARFNEWRLAGTPLALATVIQTAGSTYSKAGRQILIRADGQHVGLVSGGCLEGDLAEHAREVIRTGTASVVTYDMRTEADDLWGMGLGCNGMLSILLQRLSTSDNWQPFADIITALADEHSSTVALVTASTNKTILVGSAYIRDNAGCWLHTPPQALHIPEHLPGNVTAQVADGRCEYLCWTVHPWPRLLLLGAGPDSVPLLEMTRTLGWEVTVADHRAHYIETLPADCASSMHVVVPGELSSDLQLERHTAVVVMSHHLDTDRKYLQELAGYQHAYIGLLGPAPRKARLLEELGLAQSDFAQRLHGPAGLAIGADTPATIALAIVSEIQSVLSPRRQTPDSISA